MSFHRGKGWHTRIVSVSDDGETVLLEDCPEKSVRQFAIDRTKIRRVPLPSEWTDQNIYWVREQLKAGRRPAVKSLIELIQEKVDCLHILGLNSRAVNYLKDIHLTYCQNRQNPLLSVLSVPMAGIFRRKGVKANR